MFPSTKSLLLLSALTTIITATSLPSKRQLPKASWGPYISLGQTQSEYTSLSTIYTPGKAPPNQKGTLFLWPGLFDQANRNGGDLVQTVIELHNAKDTTTTCGAKQGQWCIRPYVVNYSARPMSKTPTYGKAIDATDRILIEYTRAAGPTGAWTQKITNLSKGNAVLFNYVAGSKKTRW
jgi:hypothetical protein